MQPEQKARQQIDDLLRHAGWDVQDREAMNLFDPAHPGVAVREAHLQTGYADYLLFVEGKALGVIEAKKAGVPLSGVEAQAERYSVGLPPHMRAWRPEEPLPFLYQSTGVETFFTNKLDPEPRSRRVFAFHRPETLRDWALERTGLRERLRRMPPLAEKDLWPPQVAAIGNLEQSLAQDRPRALIQMATGSGKTVTAVNFIYRLIQYANARRVLFLVDRTNLGEQAHNAFTQFETPDDGRKFSELYNIRHMHSNAIDVAGDVNRVYISTIQRLYSILKGEEEFDAANETRSMYELLDDLPNRPGDLTNRPTVRFEGKLPIEFFDFIVIDECHRSIYTIWKQVLEYFDAYYIGLTATPGKQTIGFFNQNLVQSYTHEDAVADGINVPGDVYRILTQISQAGSVVESGYYVGKMDRLTRDQREERLDEDFVYTARQLDRDVVSVSQIRTLIRTFRDKLFTEIFPGRQIVPKTLIFAKDDNHAENIVRIVREEFGKGNDFCQKITYRADRKPKDILQDFRNSYNPRIAVTVDMIATGTDVRAIEILLFMRLVRSRGYFEQMRGRGTRIIQTDELQGVTSDAAAKTHFVLVDTVGLTEVGMTETAPPLERKRTVPFAKLLEQVGYGAHDPDTVSSLAGRLARLRQKMTSDEEALVADYGNGRTLPDLIHGLLAALDDFENRPTALWEATEPLRANPKLRQTLIDIQQRNEIVIDRVSEDVVLEAGFDTAASDQLRQMVADFRQFIEENKDELTALQILYNQPYSQRALTLRELKALNEALQRPPHFWTEEKLWRAYAQLERDKVRGVGAQRVLTDLIALVRHAIQPEATLAPYPEQVRARYEAWLAAQEAAGRQFSPEQRWWLDRIAGFIGLNLQIAPDDLDLDGEMYNRGGRFAAAQALGEDWRQLLEEMNRELVV